MFRIQSRPNLVSLQSSDKYRSNRYSTRISASEAYPLLLRVARGEGFLSIPSGDEIDVICQLFASKPASFDGLRRVAVRFSDKYPFRMRSETPSIAIELSLQPYEAFQTDGVIMFSDILTPLPSLGIDFDVIKGKGPIISNPIRRQDQLDELKSMSDPSESLFFVEETLSTLRQELSGKDVALIGFIGTPWTLAAYTIEGKATKNCITTKTIMRQNPRLLHSLLDHLTTNLIQYVDYQIQSGAQIVQLFDSWAHHLSPSQFLEFSLPYVNQIIQATKNRHPEVPVIFHMNGGTGKLEFLKDCPADVVGLDWLVEMSSARRMFPDTTIQGNLDPLELLGTEKSIQEAVERCLQQAGSEHHILNLGHGVVQTTPENSVEYLCELCRSHSIEQKTEALVM